MRKVIMADVGRVQKKAGYIVCMSIIVFLFVLAGILAMVLPLKLDGVKSPAKTMEIYATGIFVFYSFLVGIPIFSAIYSDDFKSKSMQTAIGFGLTRYKIIWARFFEGLFLLVESGVIFSVVYGMMQSINDIPGKDAAKSILNEIWIRDLKILGFLCISLIIVYGTQKPGGGLVLYILLLAAVFDMMISAIDLIPFLADHNISISKYFPSEVISSLQKNVTEGNTGTAIFQCLAFIACYIVVPVFISIGIFDKKELDF